MARLEDLTRGASVKGIIPDGFVTVENIKWIGSTAVELIYKDTTGQLGSELLYRDREESIEIIEAGSPWSFDANGCLFRLVSEAHRIRLAVSRQQKWHRLAPLVRGGHQEFSCMQENS